MKRPRKQKKRRRTRLLLALMMLAALLLLAEWQLSPIIARQARTQAHNAALTMLSGAVETQLAQNSACADYRQIMHIGYDQQGRIAMLTPDTMLLNQLIADIVLDAERRFAAAGGGRLSLPLGAALGSKLFADLGPELHVGFRTVGAPMLELRDDFVAVGINQTRHRIYLDLSAEISVTVPFERESFAVATTVLLAEGIIVGIVPDTYVSVTPKQP
ncbi:MAG: sporulation protein YunB [Bacillota bacterium]|nr:sporulation protein YunB [Bacillota bacterium]